MELTLLFNLSINVRRQSISGLPEQKRRESCSSGLRVRLEEGLGLRGGDEVVDLLTQ